MPPVDFVNKFRVIDLLNSVSNRSRYCVMQEATRVKF